MARRRRVRHMGRRRLSRCAFLLPRLVEAKDGRGDVANQLVVDDVHSRTTAATRRAEEGSRMFGSLVSCALIEQTEAMLM
jgi:hypothetical protein